MGKGGDPEPWEQGRKALAELSWTVSGGDTGSPSGRGGQAEDTRERPAWPCLLPGAVRLSILGGTWASPGQTQELLGRGAFREGEMALPRRPRAQGALGWGGL